MPGNEWCQAIHDLYEQLVRPGMTEGKEPPGSLQGEVVSCGFGFRLTGARPTPIIGWGSPRRVRRHRGWPPATGGGAMLRRFRIQALLALLSATVVLAASV